VIESVPVKINMHFREQAVSPHETRVARDRLVKQANGFEPVFLCIWIIGRCLELFFCLNVELIGDKIGSRWLLDRHPFRRRKSGPELVGNRFSDFALDSKNIS
jgi:hypothetical protein